ncbi:IclR family transcriptional regulator [Arthrobacter globiformis]|uniref:IclR family transcriptional regulator n=1 Tax=Arthrobacter globiformis TaxID=1665 RepID=UPI00278DAEF5|nr:IclR family transcriptional regulator [Arthrobacter globiformis]MDQ0616689.1 DNA-binding IclR family transcriptional regulator [Arthrobacter globiformis]
MTEHPPTGESVISRVAKLMGTFDRQTPAMPLSTLASRAGLPLTTTHRMVIELIKHGFLERDPSGDIRPGLKFWELASRSSPVLGLREAALPFMEDVQASIGQATLLSVLDGRSVLYLEQLAGRDSTLSAGRMAERMLIHCCSAGLVLLAFAPPEYQESYLSGPLEALTNKTVTEPVTLRRNLAEIRRVGYYCAPGFGVPDRTGISVPVLGPGNGAVAALSIIYPQGQENIQAAVPALATAAHGLARALGRRTEFSGHRKSTM